MIQIVKSAEYGVKPSWCHVPRAGLRPEYLTSGHHNFASPINRFRSRHEVWPSVLLASPSSWPSSSCVNLGMLASSPIFTYHHKWRVRQQSTLARMDSQKARVFCTCMVLLVLCRTAAVEKGHCRRRSCPPLPSHTLPLWYRLYVAFDLLQFELLHNLVSIACQHCKRLCSSPLHGAWWLSPSTP